MESTGTLSGDCEANASATQVGRAKGVAIDAARYSSFPRNLLPLVFSHLPLPHLLNLQHLSPKVEWVLEYLNDPGLVKSCARRWESHALCAVILKEPNSATYDVGVVHSGESITLAWHKLRLHRREPLNTLCSGDGGLVCFCLTLEEEGGGLHLVLGVLNPLTGACRMLPSDHGVSPFDLRMMQLVVDKSTRQYQVLLVHDEEVIPASNDGNGASENEPASSSAASGGDSQSSEESEEESQIELFPNTLGGMIFDSGTGVWSNARSSSQVFLGPAIHEKRYVRDPGSRWRGSREDQGDGDAHYHSMDYHGCSGFFGPMAYDCASGRVLFLRGYWFYVGPLQFALSNTRVFTLHLAPCLLRERQIFVVEGDLWLAMVKDHKFDLPQKSPGPYVYAWYMSHLQYVACEGFVLVRAPSYKNALDRASDLGQLYDVGARESVDLLERKQDPAAPQDEPVEPKEKEKAEEELPRAFVKKCRRQVRAYGDRPRYFASAPFMLCNLDWEAVP